jgi:predicted metal-dependent phosphoesterase TrpH
MVDLHTHTTASDGVLTPSQLVEQAAAGNITTLAITDHDTVNGIAEGLEAAAKYGITLIPGIEISTKAESFADEIHLVGLFIDIQNSQLLQKLELLHNYRENRNKKIIEKLGNIGINIPTELLFNMTSRPKNISTLGKPDFAKALYKIGAVKHEAEAFGKFLNDKNGLAGVPKERIDLEEAITLIHNAGGLAILAHPFHITKNYNDLYALIEKYSQSGLDGLEVYYNNYNRKQIKNLKKLSENFGLLKSGGSDFHFAGGYRQARLGFFGEKKNIPDDILKDIMRRKG